MKLNIKSACVRHNGKWEQKKEQRRRRKREKCSFLGRITSHAKWCVVCAQNKINIFSIMEKRTWLTPGEIWNTHTHTQKKNMRQYTVETEPKSFKAFLLTLLNEKTQNVDTMQAIADNLCVYGLSNSFLFIHYFTAVLTFWCDGMWQIRTAIK